MRNTPKTLLLFPWSESSLEVDAGGNVQLHGIFENTPLTQITETAK